MYPTNFASPSDGLEHATIEFVRSELLAEGLNARIPVAVSECALADVVGEPHLIRTIRKSDGTMEFRYRMNGVLQSHID